MTEGEEADFLHERSVYWFAGMGTHASASTRPCRPASWPCESGLWGDSGFNGLDRVQAGRAHAAFLWGPFWWTDRWPSARASYFGLHGPTAALLQPQSGHQWKEAPRR